MYQRQLIDRLEKSFGNRVKSMKKPMTPGTPKQTFEKVQENNPDLLKKEDMDEYRSMIGSLMYLLKYSRPELSNCVRELAKGMKGVSEMHQNKLY